MNLGLHGFRSFDTFVFVGFRGEGISATGDTAQTMTQMGPATVA